MRWTELEDHFLQQGQTCRQLGSPFYGELMPLLSQSICRHSALGRALLCWPVPARESALALRIAAALHYLFLAGKPGPVAALYRGGGQAKAGLLHQALAEHENHILDCIQSPPQTNEIGRSLALLIGALAIAEKGSNQLDLYELGSSAGLNLNFDHYLFQAQTWYWGQADSPVTIHSKISGSPADARFEIGRRWGCDLNPIHVPKQQQRLLSYIWPDQRERLARTRAACEMFSQSPNCLQRADASDWLEQAAKQFRPGRGALLFHSMFFQYLSPLQQRKLIETIEAIGKEASEQTPFYWLTFEPSADRKQAELILRQWPGGDCRKLAKGSFHGDYLTLM